MHILENIPLAPYTTYKIGGPSRYFTVPDSLDQLREALDWCGKKGIPWFVLGKGSNILVSDQGFPGMAIKPGKGFNHIELDKNNNLIKAGSSVQLQRLVTAAAKAGYIGFAPLAGIPGTVGGAVRMNAGTKEGEIKDLFISGSILMPDLTTKEAGCSEFGFSYRNSDFLNKGCILLDALFQANGTGDPEKLKNNVAHRILQRKKKQPKNTRNCGSVFRNPPNGHPAGYYIEKAGLKGLRIGGAQVAHEHANWIINQADTTAQDIRDLIIRIKAEVSTQFGVTLEEEVIFIPDNC